MKKVMYIFRGLPGSGKSTKVKQLVKEIQLENCHGGTGHRYFVIHSTDNYFSVCGTYRFNQNRLHVFHKFNQEDAEKSCEIGIDYVMIDNTNTTLKEMQPYLDIAKKYGYRVEFVESDTTWKFDIEECARRNTHGVPKEAIQRMLDRWNDTDAIKHLLQSKVK